MTQSIFEYLDQMPAFVQQRDWDGLERRFAEVAVTLAGKGVAKQLADVDLTQYRERLADGLAIAVRKAEEGGCKAVYFEYDLDNGWSSNFFLCEHYAPLEEEDDDWACDYTDHVAGPDLPAFAAAYKKAGGFDRTPLQTGTTLLLVARTVAAFGGVAARAAGAGLAVCMAFHDQDPILRISEPA